MAAAIFGVDRKLGVAALLWTAIVILLPRFVLNYHYPSDLLAGAAAGALVSVFVMRLRAPAGVLGAIAQAEQEAPAIAYPACFLFAVAAATNFELARAAAKALLGLF